jgi:hypothetical protein
MSVLTSQPATGTFSFSPSAADVVGNAFRKIQIPRAELTTEHLFDAAMESNFLAIDISNRNPNGWQGEVLSQPLTQGTATYILTGRTILIPIATLVTTDSSGNVTERVLGSISRSDYATYPNKAYQAPPTSILFQLLNPPAITLYPTPDGNGPYSVSMWSFRQMQDVDLVNGYSLDAPYRFLDSYATGLAARLAQIYRPEQADKLEALFEARFKRAAATDQEATPIAIIPGLQGYYR